MSTNAMISMGFVNVRNDLYDVCSVCVRPLFDDDKSRRQFCGSDRSTQRTMVDYTTVAAIASLHNAHAVHTDLICLFFSFFFCFVLALFTFAQAKVSFL